CGHTDYDDCLLGGLYKSVKLNRVDSNAISQLHIPTKTILYQNQMSWLLTGPTLSRLVKAVGNGPRSLIFVVLKPPPAHALFAKARSPFEEVWTSSAQPAVEQNLSPTSRASKPKSLYLAS
ncbi:Ribosomal protein L1p/L10e family, partial [Prunus dulcis]